MRSHRFDRISQVRMNLVLVALLLFAGCQSAKIKKSNLSAEDLASLCLDEGTYRAELWVASELKNQKSISFPASFVTKPDGAWVFQAQDLFGGEMLTLIYGRSALEIRSYLKSIPSQTVSISELGARLPASLRWVSQVRDEFPTWLRGGLLCGSDKTIHPDSKVDLSSLEVEECGHGSPTEKNCILGFKTNQNLTVRYRKRDSETGFPKEIELLGSFGSLSLKTMRSEFLPNPKK